LNNSADNGGDCSRVGSVGVSKGRDWRRREVRVDALSSAEWLYLFGLFLADGFRGSFYHGRAYQGGFFLQWDERELAERVASFLERAGLRPMLRFPKKGRMVEVRVFSVQLLGMLPDGWSLLDDVSARERFFEGNDLFSVRGGIPFLAGLIDGDGSCSAIRMKAKWAEKCVYGVVDKWHWTFAQSKFPFLVDYVKRFLGVVAPMGGFHVYEVKGGYAAKGVGYHVCLTKPVITALMSAGFAEYSWKAARWQSKVAEFRSRRASYYRLSEAAAVLHVNRKTVWRRLQAGKVKYVRRSQWFYIPAQEVERLAAERDNSAARIENHEAHSE